MSSPPAEPEEGSPRPAEPRAGLEMLSTGVAASLFFAAFLVLPIAGLVALPLAAVPIVRAAHRRGIAFASASVVLAGILVFLLGWTTGSARDAAREALLAAALMALPGAFAAAVRRGTNPSAAYLGLCVAGFLLACGFLLAQPRSADTAMQKEIDRGFDEWLRLSSQSRRPSVDSETAARLRVTLEAARAFCKRFWVGLIGTSWVLCAAVAFYVGAWAARPQSSAEITRFERLRIPALVAALFVATGASWVLAPDFPSRIAGNLLWPLVALYFVAGLSIICHFARGWLRARILRVGVYTLVVYVPINVGVALLGLFDWYADFRRRSREIKES